MFVCLSRFYLMRKSFGKDMFDTAGETTVIPTCENAKPYREIRIDTRKVNHFFLRMETAKTWLCDKF